MNFRTTFLLFLAVIGAVGLSYFVRQQSIARKSTSAVEPAPKDSPVTRDVLDAKLGDVDKVTIRRKNQPEWAFTRTEQLDSVGRAMWKMTAPVETTVSGVDLDRIRTQLTGLKYDISFKPGAPGTVSAATAGLDPADVVITLTDKSGAAATIEVGRPKSDNETYLRLGGKDEILVAKSNLKNLVKTSAVEFRDPQLWNFAADKVTQIEVIDRSEAGAPVTFVFTRDGADWAIKTPIAAKATGKVEEMAKALARLRVTKWEDDRKEKLAVYGLEPARWTIRTTVKEEVPVEKKPEETTNDNAESEPATTTKLTVHELHLSDRSPLGEDTKAYARVGEEPFSATLAKSITDKFKPNLSEWRDMRVFPQIITSASRIQIDHPQGSATLAKKIGRWAFEGEDNFADDTAVQNLLKNIQDLSAVAFSDGETVDEKAAGFDQPQVGFTLTIPGSAAPERLTIGGFTDAASKRLVFARRNDEALLAKIRATDATTLASPVLTYRDRAVVDVLPLKMERLSITAPSPYRDEPTTTVLEQKDAVWSMTAPVPAGVRTDKVNELVNALSVLRADAILPGQSPSEFGLDQPSVRVALTYKPAVEHLEESAEQKPAEGQSAPVSVEIQITQHDGKYVAKRSDRPTIYQIPASFYLQLTAELRAGEVFSFDDKLVSKLRLRDGATTHAYEKTGDKWIYAAEKDLPIDAKKVQNLVLQFKDLKTDRYVVGDTQNLDAVGLAQPAKEFALTLEDGTTHALLVSSRMADKGVDKGYFAMIRGRSDVFLLTQDAVNRFQISPDKLEPDAKKP